MAHDPTAGMSSAECSTVLMTSEAARLGALSRSITRNYIVIAISAGVVLGAGFVLIIIGLTAYGTYVMYRKMTAWSRAAGAAGAKKQSKQSGIAGAGDDEVWNADVLASDPPLSTNDATRIKGAMTRLKGRYAGYNKALTDFDRDIKGREPDDLMDEKILSDRHDDYTYESSADRKRDLRMQRRGATAVASTY